MTDCPISIEQQRVEQDGSTIVTARCDDCGREDVKIMAAIHGTAFMRIKCQKTKQRISRKVEIEKTTPRQR